MQQHAGGDGEHAEDEGPQPSAVGNVLALSMRP